MKNNSKPPERLHGSFSPEMDEDGLIPAPHDSTGRYPHPGHANDDPLPPTRARRFADWLDGVRRKSDKGL